jgi:succinate-acetate transporter protein
MRSPAFTLTKFLLSLINFQVRYLTRLGIVISLGSAYHGFWISLAIILTLGGFGIKKASMVRDNIYYSSFALCLLVFNVPALDLCFIRFFRVGIHSYSLP